MVLKETALRKRAKKFELKGLLKVKLDPSCLSALEELLNDIYVVGRPSPDDYHVRGDLVRVFNVMAKEVFGNANDFPVVEAFGSFLMDMFSNQSDLDLSINFSNESAELPREEKIIALKKFAKKLYRIQSKGHVFGVMQVLTAKVPILKVVDRGTKIECDISVENKDGILKSQFVFIVSEIDERFQKLSSLMKAWAKAYDINSSKDRTLNSLSIILLVAFHLQTREPPILPPFSALLKDGTNPESVRKVVQEYLHYGKENKESLAELFATLLSRLASVETLWPEGLCVSAYEGSWISKTWDHRVASMSVEDFTDRTQNVARAVGKEGAKEIYKSIHSSLHHLSSFLEGRIQAPKLKTHLFGAEQIPPLDADTTNHKRSFPFHDTASPTPLDSALTKKAWPTDGWSSPTEGSSPPAGWSSWGGVKYYQPPVTAHQFILPGFQQGELLGSWGGDQLDSNRAWGPPAGPLSTPNGGDWKWKPLSAYHQFPKQDEPNYPHEHGWDHPIP